MIEKDTSGLMQAGALFFQMSSQRAGRFGPKRANPFLASFTPQQHAGRQRQMQIASLEADGLADPGAGVEQECQYNEVAMAIGGIQINILKHGLDFGELQMVNLSRPGPLERNAEQPLGEGKVFRLACSEVTHKTVNGAESHVTCIDSVFSTGFQVLQERGNLLHRQLLDRQLGRVSFFSCHKLQEQLQAVPVAV